MQCELCVGDKHVICEIFGWFAGFTCVYSPLESHVGQKLRRTAPCLRLDWLRARSQLAYTSDGSGFEHRIGMACNQHPCRSALKILESLSRVHNQLLVCRQRNLPNTALMPLSVPRTQASVSVDAGKSENSELVAAIQGARNSWAAAMEQLGLSLLVIGIVAGPAVACGGCFTGLCHCDGYSQKLHHHETISSYKVVFFCFCFFELVSLLLVVELNPELVQMVPKDANCGLIELIRMPRMAMLHSGFNLRTFMLQPWTPDTFW